MRSRLVLPLLLVAGGALVSTAGDWFPHTVKARRWCCLPKYDYSHRRVSLPRSGTTSTAILWPRGAVVLSAAGGRNSIPGRIYQLQQSGIQNDHCLLSDVAVTLFENGDWIVSCRAVQNPELVEPDQQPVFERFKRNRFMISVRGLGAFPLTEPTPDGVLAKPMLFNIELPDEWMERGEVRTIRRQQPHGDKNVQRYFNDIDRIEVELRYE